MSVIKKEKRTVDVYTWQCDLCRKKLEMQSERALLKLIERHQDKDKKDRELHEKFRDIKAHVSEKREVSA